MTKSNNKTREQVIEALFLSHTGTSIQAMLQPISAEFPSGESLKNTSVYRDIRKAREADDPNLPMGDWQHKLKVADWDQVTSIAISAITEKSKDLQILVWLLEAQIYKAGFSGIAPTMHLLRLMLETFWSSIFPLITEDLEYRTNLIAWCNDKLLPVIRQIPISALFNDKAYCWADWEIALHVEQLPKETRVDTQEYDTSQNVNQAIAVTPIAFYQALYQDISDAVNCIKLLDNFLQEKCADQTPSLANLINLLLKIQHSIFAQVKHRGLFENGQEGEVAASNTLSSPASFGNNNDTSHNISGREQAYYQLAKAAEYLLLDDPHSPAPYLVFKAIEWGKLNTAELYQELFVEHQGQLNIFKMLGLELKQ